MNFMQRFLFSKFEHKGISRFICTCICEKVKTKRWNAAKPTVFNVQTFSQITIAALTIGSFAGCGSNNTSTGTGAADTQGGSSKEAVEITNVSYDPTRELYEEYNKIFEKHWREM